MQAGAGPNTDDGHPMTYLMYAVLGRQSKVVALLLSWPGVDANAKDGVNKTALHWACEAGHIPVLQLLLAVPGLKLNERISGGGGHTPILLAIAAEQYQVFKILANLDGSTLMSRPMKGKP